MRGKLHIEKISAWKPDDSTFEPVSGSISFPAYNNQVPGIPGNVRAGSRISGDAPDYPLSAKLRQVTGDVVLSAIISRTGTLKEIDVISSPDKEFVKAAIDAVSKWRYKPYLLNNQPVEVDTIVTVHFGFGS